MKFGPLFICYWSPGLLCSLPVVVLVVAAVAVGVSVTVIIAVAVFTVSVIVFLLLLLLLPEKSYFVCVFTHSLTNNVQERR